MKVCNRCGRRKSVDKFNRHKSSRDGRDGSCKECRQAYMRQYYKDHPEVYAELYRRSKDRINKRKRAVRQPTVSRLMKDQGGRCAICRSKLNDKVPGNHPLKPQIDHDHTCCPADKWCDDCVRGLLCRSCNYGLGCFKDSPDLLAASLAYLRRN